MDRDTDVDVLHAGKVVCCLRVLDGDVNADTSQPVRRSMTATLVGPTDFEDGAA